MVKGICYHQGDAETPLIWAPYLQPLRAKTTRIEVMWDRIEPEDGVINWGEFNFYDQQVQAALSRGIVPIILFGYKVPVWARAWDDAMAPPSDPAKFGKFARFIAKRWQNTRGFEVYNEQNLSGHWGNRTPDPKYYAQLLTAAYNQIKQVNKDRVILGGLSPGWIPGGIVDDVYLKAVINNGGKFDAVGIHPYGTYPNAVTACLNRIRNITKKPLVATEFGWSSCSIRPHCVSEKTQADYTLNALKRLNGNVTDAILYMLHDEPPDEVNTRFGVLRGDYTKKPVFFKFRNYVT